MANTAHFMPTRTAAFASAHANRTVRPRGTPFVGWLDRTGRSIRAVAARVVSGALVINSLIATNAWAATDAWAAANGAASPNGAAAANGGAAENGAAAESAIGPDDVQRRLDELTGAGADAPVQFAAPDVLLRFYQQRDFALAWDDARARAFIEVLRAADTQGLSPSDYLIGDLPTLLALSSLDGTARIDADAELTEAFLRYAYHNRFGKVDPRQLDTSWNYARNVSSGAYAALERTIAAPDLATQLEVEVGHGAMYESLRVVLARYRRYVAAGGWKTIAAGPTLKRGVVDSRVRGLRTRLAHEGFDAPAGADPNLFDEALAKAVEVFQTHHGLASDGVVGAKTLEEINIPATALVDRLRINLERLRWVLVERTSRFVAVNIAGFEVYYIDDDRVQWNARAMVGKPYRATPIFRADMTYLVINPDWTVPPTILRNDSLPALKRDHGYLEKQRMDVVDRNGRVVNPAKIDWSNVTPKNFPYMLRQRPGPKNALGRIKFMFPNEHFVFLHDTPSRELFSREERAFSSGCIRVEHPFELAELLLKGDPKWTAETLKAAVDSERMQSISLKKPIPVLILYLTAVAFDGGKDYTFRRDIYDRDAAVLHALNAGFVYSAPTGL
jgi:murein L,D-transpeptidase YcbB/YkuD